MDEAPETIWAEQTGDSIRIGHDTDLDAWADWYVRRDLTGHPISEGTLERLRERVRGIGYANINAAKPGDKDVALFRDLLTELERG